MKVDREFECARDALRTAAFGDGTPPSFHGVRADPFLDLVDEQRLAPWLARHQRALPGLPASIAVELDALYYREARDAGARALEITAIRHALSEAPPCILLKGTAWLAQTGADLAERPFWDLDLLARNEQEAGQISARLHAAGFTAIRSERTHHHLPALRRPAGELAVEIHLDLHTPSPGHAFRAALIDESEPAPAPWTPFWIPSTPARVAHQALHAFSDLVDSPLLRNLFEIARDTRGFTPYERDAFVRIATQTPLASTIARALALARDWFGSPQLLDPPGPAGWLERLAGWRVRQLPGDSRSEKFMRHLVREAAESIKHGEGENAIGLPARVGARTFQRLARARLGLSNDRIKRIPAARWESIELDGHALLADPSTGTVHLLQPEAYATWKAARDGQQAGTEEARRALQKAGLLDAP